MAKKRAVENGEQMHIQAAIENSNNSNNNNIDKKEDMILKYVVIQEL